MSQTCSIFAVVLLLAVQFCVGEKSCSLWSSAGPVVPLETTFTVYCSFNCNCKGSMSSGHPPVAQSHSTLNSTTIYFKVVNITKNRTYSCHCNCSPALDPCGLDISAGYLPDRPRNVSCTYKVKDNESGDVFCTWNRGRDTLLGNSSTLWIRTVSVNGTDELHLTRKGADSPSASFPLSTSVQLISVWVHVQNPLGSAESSTITYTLRDIVMPSSPELVQVDCSSRGCSVTVKQPVRTDHLEIQYTAGQTWTAYTQQVAQMTSVWSISSLEPYRLYHFKARSKFATGLWSEWSSNISSRTGEEAPAEELDVWYAEGASDLNSLRVYWKEPHISVSRGKIAGYQLEVSGPDSGRHFIANASADVRDYSVPFCPNCKVTVWARNSKGLSPPASVTARYAEAQPPQKVRVTGGERDVAISWAKPVTAPLPVAYLVEWYPAGHKMEELRWVRLRGNDRRVVITDMKAFECYEGAVFVFYSDNSASSTTFTGVATQESGPTAGPRVHYTVEENRVTWTELHRGQRMGCITKYTIYLEDSSEHQKTYAVPASERGYVIQGLSPDSYSLWMTASTAAAEGPAGQKVRFFIQKSQLSLSLLVCGVVSVVLLFVVCLCQCSAVKQRFWMFFQCLILDVVPDPANSKWAKECTQEKGKMNLQIQSDSGTKEEEEPILVNVEELPKQTSGSVSSQYPAQTCRSPDAEPATLLYPVTTYITSLSHNSDSSDHTHASMDTNTTVDYISNQEPGHMHEDDEEEEDEEFAEALRFFPSPVFLEQLDFGGKLTLDSVKIS